MRDNARVFRKTWTVAAILSLAQAILAEQSPVVTQAIAKIVEERDQTAEYVLEVKRRYKPDDVDYQKARDLYVTALSKHNAWITTLKIAVQKGKTKNLANDEAYQRIAADADEASRAFVAYVQSRPGVTKSRGLGAAAGVTIGRSIWNSFREKRQQARDEEAERLARETRWKRWEEIKVESE